MMTYLINHCDESMVESAILQTLADGDASIDNQVKQSVEFNDLKYKKSTNLRSS